MTPAPVAVVVGPPGAGKSTVGALLAERLGVAFRDVDADIAAGAGKSISAIFTEDGEAQFRVLEEHAVAVALAEHAGVVALGGGAVCAAGTRQRLAVHTVVFLNVGMAQGVRRTGLSTARPLLTGLNPRARFKALLDERLPLYRAAATFEVDTDDRAPGEIAASIQRQLRANHVERQAESGAEQA